MQTWLTLWQGRRQAVRAHFTWILVLLLGVWSLARFTLLERLASGGWVWTTAVLVMAAYCGCVLVHEAGHLLAARLLHVLMPVLNLHPIGTLARRGHEPAGPYRTAMVATAGPLASLGLWLVLGTTDGPPGTLWTVVVDYAAWFSFVLMLVNLLPGLPPDGGRILRAIVWTSGTFASGTRIATYAGYAVTGGMLLLGLRAFGSADALLRGVWLLLLAWLVYDAGAALARRRSLGQLFERLRARDMTVPPPYVIEPHAALQELVALWQGDTGENYTPVVHEGAVVGLIGRSQAYDVPQGYWAERTVGMTMQPPTPALLAHPEAPLSQVLPLIDPDPFHPVPLLVVALQKPFRLQELLDAVARHT
jgi:Zn-dependent protease